MRLRWLLLLLLGPVLQIATAFLQRPACNQEQLAQASRGFGNTLAAASSHLSRRGDPPAVCTRTPLQLHYHTHGGLTPVSGRKRPQLQLRYSHPRRAHARRSWERAFVHRKNRFFAGKRSLCNKSGGRKPPVGNKTPMQIATVHIRRAACVQPGAAGVSQPWFRETHLQRQHRTSGTRATGRLFIHQHCCN
jgi:hypothetical protein